MATNDLITLSRALQQLPSGVDQQLTASLITACSNVVQNYCNRVFAQQTWDELHHGTGTPSLFVGNPPIVSVSAVRTSPLPAMYLQNTDNTNQTATGQVLNGQLTLTTIKNAVTTTQNFSFTDYPTMLELSDAVNAYGHSWKSTLSNQYATWATSDLGANRGSFGCRNLVAPLIVHWYYLPYYQVNQALGELFSFSCWIEGYQNWRVTYVGGFELIPEEIQQATAELVQNAYASQIWTPGMASESLDKYSYTRDTTSAAQGAFNTLSIASKRSLDWWRIPSVARYTAI